MADPAYQINLKSLKRVDPRIVGFRCRATHVSLYTFDSILHTWHKTDQEGPLFLCDTSGGSGSDDIVVILLNRNKPENFSCRIAKGACPVELNSPYIYVQCADGQSSPVTYSFWFLKPEECALFGQQLISSIAGAPLVPVAPEIRSREETGSCAAPPVLTVKGPPARDLLEELRRQLVAIVPASARQTLDADGFCTLLRQQFQRQPAAEGSLSGLLYDIYKGSVPRR